MSAAAPPALGELLASAATFARAVSDHFEGRGVTRDGAYTATLRMQVAIAQARALLIVSARHVTTCAHCERPSTHRVTSQCEGELATPGRLVCEIHACPRCEVLPWGVL